MLHLRRSVVSLSGILILLGTPMAFSSPLEDLSSPSQATRDAAAKALHEKFVSLTREQLAPLLRALHIGEKRNDVSETLRSIGAKQERVMGGVAANTITYRVNEQWVVRCLFSTGALVDTSLVEDMIHVWVDPSDEFTGEWTTYFVNGQPSEKIEYKEGIPLGKFTTFHPDGSPSVIRNYGALGIDGEEFGYYVSGAVEHRGSYKNGIPVGIWTWYNEDGSVRLTQDRSELE